MPGRDLRPAADRRTSGTVNRAQGPVRGTCVWRCVLRLGTQTGDDVRESGKGTMGMTSHCSVWLCDRRLKNSRHRTAETKWRICYDGCTTLVSVVLAEREEAFEMVTLPLIGIFMICFYSRHFSAAGVFTGYIRRRGWW